MSILFIEDDLPQPLTKEETDNYFKEYYAGDEKAREIIITHNIRLVISRVLNRFNNTKVPKEDLVSAGLIGLVYGFNKYIIKKDIAFSTYIVKAIDNEIIRYLNDENKKKPCISLENPYHSNRPDITIKDNINDDRQDMVKDYEDKMDYILLRKAINALPENEQKIIKLFYGFDCSHAYKDIEIANKLGVTRQEINHLLLKARLTIKKTLIFSGLYEVTDVSCQDNLKNNYTHKLLKKSKM